MVFSTKYIEFDNITTEIITSLGITLISAGTIGVIAEIFLIGIIAKKILTLESSFISHIIPQIIQTVHSWIEKEGKSIPIDKDSLYNLIRIGYTQWFMKEDFEKVGIPSSRISKLYQDVQLEEFKEPLIHDYSCTIKHLGKISKDIVIQDNLINLSVLTKFVAINTAKLESKEIRYVNKNGLISVFIFDVFEKLPITKEEKEKYIKNISSTLKIKDSQTLNDFDISLVEMDDKITERISDKTQNDLALMVESKIDRPIKQGEAFALYRFQGSDSNMSNNLTYGVFCPYKLKPQEKIIISDERILPFAENDFFHTRMKSLTQGVIFRLVGFEDYETSIYKHFLSDEKETMNHTKDMLSTTALMLPHSVVNISWQKKIQKQ